MLASMSELLKKAQKEQYAVPNFDVWNSEMLFGVMRAVEETRSPVILAFASGFAKNTDITYFAPMLVEIARRSPMPVAVHWDHGKNLEIIKTAVGCGFNAIMVDASANAFAENVRLTREVVDFCSIRGIPVEAELGHIGPETKYEELLTHYGYTDPAEAGAFTEQTGIDALAVAIGNAHGVYTSEPRINFEILSQVRAEVAIPLVLHGASGISDRDIRECIRLGITKVNIHTELCQAALEAIDTHPQKQQSYLGLQQEVMAAVAQRAKEKILLFGCDGKG
jgi:ketose-bisphosphate aldolase